MSIQDPKGNTETFRSQEDVIKKYGCLFDEVQIGNRIIYLEGYVEQKPFYRFLVTPFGIVAFSSTLKEDVWNLIPKNDKNEPLLDANGYTLLLELLFYASNEDTRRKPSRSGSISLKSGEYDFGLLSWNKDDSETIDYFLKERMRLFEEQSSSK